MPVPTHADEPWEAPAMEPLTDTDSRTDEADITIQNGPSGDG